MLSVWYLNLIKIKLDRFIGFKLQQDIGHFSTTTHDAAAKQLRLFIFKQMESMDSSFRNLLEVLEDRIMGLCPNCWARMTS